jgi:GTPase SAR1 family protein
MSARAGHRTMLNKRGAALRSTMRSVPLLALDPSPLAQDIDPDRLLSLFRILNAALVFDLSNEEQLREIASVLLEIIRNDETRLSQFSRSRDNAWLRRTQISRCPLNLANATAASYAGAGAVTDELSNAILLNVLLKGSITDYGYTGELRAALTVAHQQDEAAAANLNSSNFVNFISAPLWQYAPCPAQLHSLWETCQQQFRIVHPSFGIWCDWYQRRLDGVGFDIETERLVALLPKEILAQGYAEANFRTQQVLHRIAREPLNRVRAIFLGHGDAGKTSLVRVLNKEDVQPGEQPMTRGVDISERITHDHDPNVDVKETTSQRANINVHYWDFGGQVMVHHTHQFFLRSNCLYVIVIDGRRNERANDDARYWLEHVRAYGGDAPVMLVGNKIDLAPVQIDLLSLQQLFPNIVDYYPLCCTQAKRKYAPEFERFERDFLFLLDGPVLTRQVMLTESEFAILEQVRTWSSSKPFLEAKAFSDLCRKLGLEKEQSKLIDLFDKLGIIIHFPDIPILDDILLNPEWLTRAVYEIMYSPRLAATKGQITRGDAFQILQSATLKDHQGRLLQYSHRQCDFVLEAMRRFHLLFSLSGENHRLVVPALLDSSQPQHGFDRTSSFAFRIRFEGFMPAHILPTLIVDRSQEIYSNQVWRFGGRFKSLSFRAEALVQADDHTRTITIWVSGPDGNEYLGVLRDRVYQSLGKMQHLKFAEEILLKPSMATSENILQEETWENYNQIRLAIKRANRVRDSEPFIATNSQEYDLRQIVSAMPQRPNKVRILLLAANPVSTSALDLEEELRALRRELEMTKFRDDISISAHIAARPDDLVRFVRSEQPSIVHFSGHGTKAGIVLRSDTSPSITEVSGQALTRFFKDRGVKLVVLNSCYTEPHAQQIVESVDAVVGTSDTLDDVAARLFSVAFYRGIGNGLSIKEALRDGADAVALHGMKDVYSSKGNVELRPLGTKEI